MLEITRPPLINAEGDDGDESDDEGNEGGQPPMCSPAVARG